MTTPEAMRQRLEVALDLADLAIEMYEAKIRREQPQLSDEEVGRHVSKWLNTRPGAEHGDAEGRRVEWPRRPRASTQASEASPTCVPKTRQTSSD